MSNSALETESISSMFNVLVKDALYSIFSIGNICCLALAVEKNPFLVKCPELPAPKNLAYFSFTVGMIMLIPAEFVIRNVTAYLNNGNATQLFHILDFLVYVETFVASFLSIGVATQHFCLRVAEAKETTRPSSAPLIFGPLVHEFHNLKDGLGPQLFLIFFIKSIFIISYTYRMFVVDGLSAILFLGAGGIELLVLHYLTSIVDETYKAFKNTSQSLK